MSERMTLFQGVSSKPSAVAAVAEATEGWRVGGALDLLLAFCSTAQDPDEVARSLASRFPGTPIIGCTTAGEHLGRDHHNGSVVVTGLRTPRVRWATGAATDLARFDEAAARRVSDDLIAKLGITRDDLSADKHFALVFIDGLSCKEELVSSLMADALEGIPLLGGSAGDDLKFAKTMVLHDGRALGSAAVFAIAECDAPFEVIKHQHYTTTPRSLVITRADVATRRVFEMDGYPAIEAYARALGLDVAAVTNDVTFMNPLTFVCGGEIYVRSIQRVEADGSIIFYCGIEEGMVLSVGGHEDMNTALGRELDRLAAARRPELFLACNCILRALEATKGKHEVALGATLARYAKHVIGFDTYGEQLAGLHINQTLVGIALHDRPEDVAS